MNVTACFVTRDHEALLPEAIDAARSVAGTFVVADTGSKDRTVEVAAAKGATVVNVDWDDDFGAACNRALAAVTTEWVLWLNPDELVTPGHWPDLREITPGVRVFAYSALVRHEMAGRDPTRCPSDSQFRLFRNDPSIRYVGRLHPKFTTPLPELAARSGGKVEATRALIRRRAHLSTLTPEKVRWTNRLIEAELRDRPGQIGLQIELGRNLLTLGETRGHELLADVAAAVRDLPERALPENAIAPLFEYLLTTPDATQRTFGPEAIRTEARKRCPNSPPVLWALAGERFRAGDFESAARDLMTLLAWGESGRADGSYDPDIVGPAAALNLAICHTHAGRFAEAAALLKPMAGHPRWARDAASVMAEVSARSARPATPVVPEMRNG